MNIILSQRIGTNPHGVTMDSLESDYVRYFSSLGANCFPISNFCSDIQAWLANMSDDRIILTGGNDVHEDNDYIKYRNDVETALIRYAIEKHIPLLGVCRGMQFIHHYFGGKLKKISGHVRTTHALTLTSSPVFNLTKRADDIVVNSYHSNTLDETTTSPDLEILARCQSDQTIEAIAHKKYPILGIMWHPERNSLEQDEAFNRELIRKFFGIE